MSLSKSEYSPDCVFCKIIAKELPAYTIYKNEFVVSFMDINPITDGHVLVVPKEHTLWVWDVKEYQRYMSSVRSVAMILRSAFGTEMVFSKIYGLDVSHAHVNLFPAHPNGANTNSFSIEHNFNKIVNSLTTLV